MKTNRGEPKIKVLVLITGSIAAVKIPLLVSKLVKNDFEVKCVLSENAEKLVQPISLSTLSRNKCVLDKDQWSDYQSKPLHIELCDWADVLVLAPLTATTLSKWATGNAQGIISSILIANDKPVIAAPAMNTKMWLNRGVQKNYELIESYDNVLLLKPSEGLLACDELGIGKIAPNDIIHLAITFILSQNKLPFQRDLVNKEFLITGGGTSEKIDAARKISNNSSGTMGLMLAQVARFRGANVKFIHGPLTTDMDIKQGIKRYQIETSAELSQLIQKEISNCDFFIMNAAVADFTIPNKSFLKISKSDFEDFFRNNIELIPDILRKNSESKKKNQVFVGFCAFTGPISNARKKIKEKIKYKGCDFIFANPIDIKDQGFGSLSANEGWLFDKKDMFQYFEKTSKIYLANNLIDKIISLNKKP